MSLYVKRNKIHVLRASRKYFEKFGTMLDIPLEAKMSKNDTTDLVITYHQTDPLSLMVNQDLEASNYTYWWAQCWKVTLVWWGAEINQKTIAGNLTLRPIRSSTWVLLMVSELLQCVISALCRKAPKDTLRMGLHAWSAASLSEVLFPLIRKLLNDWPVTHFPISQLWRQCLRSP